MSTARVTEWRLNLPYKRPPLNLNQRLHWAAKARLTRQIGADVHLLAIREGLPKGLDRVGIVLYWQAKLNRRRDTDNITATLKVAIDALTRYGLVVDDDSEHVTSATVIESRAPVDAVWLSIFELRGGPETAERPATRIRPGEECRDCNASGYATTLDGRVLGTCSTCGGYGDTPWTGDTADA